ncbi:MAG: DUF4037 domain-containing protein [Clostridia bacterium]|nr:DUF4037 domain-containing protein [Clostridia bacterium]
MKGLELSERYYTECAKAALERDFAPYADKIAVGIAGEGSDCFGYDDEISQDHDFEPGFCMWITPETEREIGFRLERFYAKLPKEFLGYKRAPQSPVSDARRGVIVIGDFYRRFLGCEGVPESLRAWLNVPQRFLAAATNGKVFRDDLGTFSAIREELKKGYPEDVRRKKLAAHLLSMSQSGQYNYARCIDHGETGAAQLAVHEFVRHTLQAVHLLNNRYCPFYKWAYRSLRDLPILHDLEEPLIFLTESGNDKATASDKREMIEDVAAVVLGEVKRQKLTEATCNNLDTHAYSVNYAITDSDLRNENILYGV